MPQTRRKAPLPLWLAAGAVAGLLSGAIAFVVALVGSAAAGLPWHRPVNVVASFVFGPQLAVADQWQGAWLQAAVTLMPAAALAGGLLYGLLAALTESRPSGGLALRLGLLVGLVAWLTVVKVIGPVAAPLTVRLVPVWVSLGLFACYGAGLALALPVQRGIAGLVGADAEEAVRPPAPARRTRRAA